MFRLPAAVLLYGLLTLSSLNSSGALRCQFLFHKQSAEVLNLVHQDAYMQWLRWEQTANVSYFHKPTEAFKLPVLKVDLSNVNVQVSAKAPQILSNYLTGSAGALWLKHPSNTASKVPFFNEPATDSIPAYYTASRSVAFGAPEMRGFTVKLPTDHPHGPKGEYQPSKIETNDDIESALLHSEHIEKMDREYGLPKSFVILPEVLTIADKTTGIGVVVRDIRKMDDGHYYLPALSIPYVGREIAKLNGTTMETLFKEHYAEALGKAKALLLLRYGLQMLTPNAQNMLIQFDRDLKPTGKIFFRDVSDAYMVKPLGTGLGFEEEVKREIEVGYPPVEEIRPFWSNSSWRFDEAGDLSVSDKSLKEWGQAHNKAYVDTLNESLGLNINLKTDGYPADVLPNVYMQLESPEGQKALKEYRRRQTEKSQPSQPKAA